MFINYYVRLLTCHFCSHIIDYSVMENQFTCRSSLGFHMSFCLLIINNFQRAVTMIAAHDSPLAAMSFNSTGTKIATASEKVSGIMFIHINIPMKISNCLQLKSENIFQQWFSDTNNMNLIMNFSVMFFFKHRVLS